MAFYVGQKVVCVDDSQKVKNTLPVRRWIAKGCVYTVRNIGECPYEPWRPHGPVVWLEEVSRIEPAWPDFPFGAFRFRPIAENKTGMAILREILDRESINERVPNRAYS